MIKGRCADACSIEDQEYFEQGITNGAAWYPISGGMQDFNYLETNCFEITIELGCHKYPPASQLAQYWNDNVDSLIRLINAVHLGVHGFVLDQLGNPIEGAVVAVSGIDKNVTSYKMGDYWRLLTPGKLYNVSVHKAGYQPQSASINLKEQSSYQLNFTLHSSP